MNMQLMEIDFMMRERETLTNAKADSLYWLGRYAQRVYMSLHLLRKYYDTDIEANSNSAYELYSNQLFIPFNSQTPSDYILSLLYSKDFANSLLSGLDFANDNALVLRGELTSETLSYIQIARYHMQSCQQTCQTNITQLQVITDNLLAFWGSVEVRILNDSIKNFLFLGKYVERLDMEIRFGYSKDRIIKTYFNMRRLIEKLTIACNEDVIQSLDELILSNKTKEDSDFDSSQILSILPNLVKI